MTAPALIHVIGKCPVKGCRTVRRNSFPGAVTFGRYGRQYSWTMPTSQGGMFPSPPELPARPSVFASRGNRTIRAWSDAMAEHGWACAAHDRFCAVKVVEGKLNPEKTCNARCESATGPACECSCAGELHGSAHM